MRVAATASLLLMAALLSGCGGTTTVAMSAGGDADRGQELLQSYGCGACHTVSGVDGADGEVGPPLEHMADRRYIAGRLPNTPDNLVHWIMDPQAVDPGTVMPDLDVGTLPARDMATYLYRH